MLNSYRPVIFLISILLISFQAYAQEKPIMESGQVLHDFGNIVETDGSVSYEFEIKNAGDAPLIITRVTASCGCTTPDWTKAPLEPGQKGSVKVTFNPKGRPGPFRKSISVYSNGNKGAFRMEIMGNVVAKPPAPAISYPYAIGELKMSARRVSYNSIRPEESVTEKIHVKNEAGQTVVLRKGKFSNLLHVDISPEVLQPGETGEINITYDARSSKRMGRQLYEIPLTIEGLDKKTDQGKIHIAANIIDNFSKFSAADKSKAGKIELSTTQLDFGVVEGKSGILPVLGGKTSETLVITNTGKSPLQIHSVSCDNDLVDISGGRKELKPGQSVTFKVTIKPKEIKNRLDTNIHVVSNDPNSPVRLIKLSAEK